MSFNTLRMAPELRRCCWYVIVGVGVLIPATLGVGVGVLQRDVVGMIAACIVFFLFAVAMFAALRWRLDVDGTGLARRRLFVWDRWSWSDFASGRVVKRYGHVFVDPQRPWWRRKLRLDFLVLDEMHQVVAAINEHYCLPPPPVVGDKLTIRWGFRRQAVFDPSGIQLMIRGTLRFYRWDEVSRVLIVRHDPLRRDFKSLDIVLPDEKLELSHITHQGGTAPTWRGATAEELNEILHRHVAARKIQVGLAGEVAASPALREKELEFLRKKQREFRQMTKILLPLCGVGIIAASATAGTVWKALLLAGVFIVLGGLPIGAVCITTLRDLRMRIRQLEGLADSGQQ